MKGAVHSFETMGCADGPGVRFVVFLQGCPLRCVYCHNPDTWDREGGELYTPNEVLEKALRYRPYFGKEGGITISGGEPLLQPRFTAALLQVCKEQGLHTAIDTSAMAGEPHWEDIFRYTDLVLADVKFTSEEDYRRYSGGSFEMLLRFLRKAEEMGVAVQLRHVVVPGLTDGDLGEVLSLADRFSNIRGVELLPFRKLCIAKYRDLSIPFPLADTPECDADLLDTLQHGVQQYKQGRYTLR